MHEITVSAIVAIVFIGVAVFDVVLAMRCIAEKSYTGKMLSRCLGCAATVSLFYLLSILTDDYNVTSFTSSVYFCFIDFMLLYLIRFFYALLKIDPRRKSTKAWARYSILLFYVLCAADAVSLMLNPYTGHAISYTHMPQFTVARYAFAPHMAYDLHLLLCYVMIAYAFAVMIQHTFRLPRVYRNEYYGILGCVAVVVLLNAFYLLTFVSHNIDISILSYSVLGAIVYYCAFVYGRHSVLNMVNEIIVTHVGLPLLVFNYKDDLIYINDAGRELFPTFDRPGKTFNLAQLLAVLQAKHSIDENAPSARFYWTHPLPPHTSFICDYQQIFDTDGQRIARSLIFTNNTLGIDALTGFQTEQYFMLHGGDVPAHGKLVGVCVCDLNQLALINSVRGYSSGNRAIAIQAECIKRCLPPQTTYIRLQDAKLGAVCTGLQQDEMFQALRAANEELGRNNELGMRLSMDFSAIVVEDGKSVTDALAEATSILSTRKLLDKESGHARTLDSLQQMLIETDPETDGHVHRTRVLGDSLAFQLGLSAYERDKLSLLCLFHDIGKVGVPLNILNKPGKLNDEEWAVMRQHVQKGYRIALATEGLEIIADPILHHHENWNGSGYPDGLSGESIPLLSRVIAVVDAYDAMVTDRVYRKARGNAEALAELKRCAGTQFDPFVVDAFVSMMERDGVGGAVGAMQGDAAEAAAQEERTESAPEVLAEKIKNDGIAPSKVSMIATVNFVRYVLDDDYNIVEIDRNFESLTGYTSYDVEKLHLNQNDLIFDGDREEYWKLLKGLESQKKRITYLEHRVKRKDGTGRYVYCMGIWGVPNRTEIVLTDITDSLSMQEQVGIARNRAMMSLRRLEESIQQDPMTKLLNKPAFHKTCEQRLLNTHNCFALMMFDVDDFKSYNDGFGHPKGDELLCALASALSAALRPGEGAGRMGGDEFCCLLEFGKTAREEEAAARAQEIRQALNKALAAFETSPTVSAGVALARKHTNDFNALYAKADEALYEAKRAGKNQVKLV